MAKTKLRTDGEGPALRRTQRPLDRRRARVTGDATGLSAPRLRLIDLFGPALDDLVHEAELLRRFGREEHVALERVLDLLDAAGRYA